MATLATAPPHQAEATPDVADTAGAVPTGSAVVGGGAINGPARDGHSAKGVGRFLVRADLHAAELSSLIDAHNGIVCKLSHVQAQLDLNFEKHAQASKDLRKLTLQLEEGRTDAERRFEDLHNQVKESHNATKSFVEDKSSAVDEKLAKAHQDLDALVRPRLLELEHALEDFSTKAEVQELNGKLESTRSQCQEAENSCASAVAQVAAQVQKLGEKIDQESSRLSTEALQAGIKALDTVRGDETLRLNKLEQSMSEAFDARFAAEERVNQDLQHFREKLKAAEAMTSSCLDSTNETITAKMEPVQQAIDILTREIHSFMQLQTEQQEEQSKVLELVTAIEGRLWPSRKSVLGPSAVNNSTSPQGTAATRELTPKAVSRPASARGQRLEGNAAGAAFGAARVARGLKCPPQRPVARS